MGSPGASGLPMSVAPHVIAYWPGVNPSGGTFSYVLMVW